MTPVPVIMLGEDFGPYLMALGCLIRREEARTGRPVELAAADLIGGQVRWEPQPGGLVRVVFVDLAPGPGAPPNGVVWHNEEPP